MRYNENINTKVDSGNHPPIQRTDVRTRSTGFNRDLYKIRPVALKKVNSNGKVIPNIRYKDKYQSSSYWFYNPNNITKDCAAYDMYFNRKLKKWFSTNRNRFIMTRLEKSRYSKLNGIKFTSDEEKMYGSTVEFVYNIVSLYKERIKPIKNTNADSYKTERFDENIGFDIYDPADDACDEAR